MIRAIIFDLDSCLAAANEVGDHLFAPAFDAIRIANQGRIPDTTLAQAFADCWRCSFDFIAEKYNFTSAMRTVGWQAFKQITVTVPMKGYFDLAVLKELPVPLFLVTSGFRRLQESKIRALGFADWFAGIQIDAIDEPDRKGKHGLFADILKNNRLAPEEVLIVGDNPDSEIDAGNRLGMKTIQILRPGVPPGSNAHRQIHGLAELKEILSTQGV